VITNAASFLCRATASSAERVQGWDCTGCIRSLINLPLLYRFWYHRMNPLSKGASGMVVRRQLSLDWWSVITALVAALLIKSGVLPHIPW
jgi:hypothetical protein